MRDGDSGCGGLPCVATLMILSDAEIVHSPGEQPSGFGPCGRTGDERPCRWGVEFIGLRQPGVTDHPTIMFLEEVEKAEG